MVLQIGQISVIILAENFAETMVQIMKFCFDTLGCKVNLFETQALAQLALERGHTLVTQDADAVILNTCAVTSISERKNLRTIHRLRRENPHAVLAVCGCFAQCNPERLKATGEVDLICGTADRASVLAACEQAVHTAGYCHQLKAAQTDQFELLRAGVPSGRTRALLKIQDGCDNYCTYCIIPYVRGHVRSMPPEAACAEARRLADAGVHEIMITGIEISSYGSDLSKSVNLITLMEQLLTNCPELRFRLGSLEPRIVDQDFCSRLKNFSNLAPHFHLSLQSGCDSVLQRMHRRYDTALYKEKMELLRSAFPHCSLTTDLIVGFPGETETEFLQTLNFIQECGFAAIHVFPYSIRKGTAAAQMTDQLSNSVKQDRASRAKAVAAACGAAYRRTFLGRTLTVLLEHPAGNGLWSGHTEYAFPVYLPSEEQNLKNTLCAVRLTALHHDGLLGEPLESHF